MAKLDFRYKQNRLQQLRGFCYAAADGSISKAAERMYLSQPSVSLQIQALERELHTVLFERRGPKIKLTPEGELLFSIAMPLVEGIDRIEDDFTSRRGDVEKGRIDLAAGWSTILYVLPDYVERFKEIHPQIELKLHNVTGQEGLAQLRAGHVDFAVGPLLHVPEDIDFYPVVSYEPLLITEPRHPLAQKKNFTLEDISHYPFILPPRHLSTWSTVDSVFKEQGLPFEVAMEVGGWEVIKKYVELGLGISVIMSICITGNEKLAIIPANKYFPNRTYGVVLRKGKVLSPQAKRFVQLMTPDIKFAD
ncbi:MAG: LysR family transcriptional regulator [Candidatus Hydrogenedentes bacterium]|nr:LysR family transcriptional regulator [Candidatus Hydrogenedentota bacterium]